MTADQPLSENSTAQWRGEGCWEGVGAGRLSEDFWEHSNICIEVIVISIRTLSLNAKACFVLQTCFMLTVPFLIQIIFVP